jgi:integrase
MGRLGSIRLKYLHAFRDHTGRARYYFRRHGIRTALPGIPGSTEFMDAYAAQLSNTPKAAEPRPAAIPGSFAALAIRYYGSPQYQSLSATSRSNYRRVIDRFLEQHGHRQIKQMTREHVDILIGKMASTPGAGIVLLKRLRTLVRYAMALGWIDRDPTAGAKAYRSKEIHTWTEGEISIFERRWIKGSRERLAFSLLLYTGQRGSDVHRMLWSDCVGDTIRVAQQKTTTKLTIPLHDDLAELLALAPRETTAILSTVYKKPFSVKGFGNMVSDAIRTAGLPPRCVPHGLRKAAARRLAEAGCSASEIMAITGHKTLAEVERYTRAAEQERLARQAIKRQSENKSGKLIREESEFAADGEVDVAGLAPGDGGLLQLIVFAGERCRPRYRTPNISQDGWTGLGCRGLGSSSAKTSTVVPPVANSLIWAR